MPVSVSFIRELETIDPKLRKVLLSMLDELERQREESVTKKEFNELKDVVRDLGQAVKELAEAQKRTEERLNELAEAQKRTEERLTRLEEAVEGLAEAQKRTEERLNELAEAQKRTEERLNELTEAQKRTEERLNELAEAQKRTEDEIAKLSKGLNDTREYVGGLSRSVSYALENEAYRHLPEFLKKYHGLEVVDRLIRTYIGNQEINVFGKVRRNGEELFLVGDAVLKLDDVSKLGKVWNQVMEVKKEFGGEVIPIIITHFARPKVLEKARKAGILVIQSFEWA